MATPQLIALLNSATPAHPIIQRDFYTITLNTGQRLYYAGADFSIAAKDATIWNPPAIDGSGGMWFPGIKWAPNRMANGDGQTAEWKLGLGANNWQLIYTPRAFDPFTGVAFSDVFSLPNVFAPSDVFGGDTIGGVPWLTAARSGALEQADVVISTAYWGGPDVYSLPDIFAPPDIFDEAAASALPAYKPLGGVSPVGTLTTFRGMIGEVDCSETAAYLTVIDYRYLTTYSMPRNLYQGSCRNRLYDDRCTLNAGGFTGNGAATGASSPVQIVTAAPVAPAGGTNTFALGTLTMQSGLNATFSRLVTKWDGATTFDLLNPFPFDIAAGDTFVVTSGCRKSTTDCNAFANIANFRGEAYIPVPEISLG